MGYSIIFETKIIKLQDGRILHLDLSGCNNDNSGRSRDEFTGKIYTEEAFNEHIKSHLDRTSNGDGFDMKIGSRFVKMEQYGRHLLRMLKQAKTYDETCSERLFRAIRYDGVQLHEPEEKVLTPKEFSDLFYELLHSEGGLKYNRITTPLNNESEIISSLDDNQSVGFHVGRKRKT